MSPPHSVHSPKFSCWQSPGDDVPPITLRPLVYEWLQIATEEMSYQPSPTTLEISPCSKSSYLRMQPDSWPSHSAHDITYGSPPVQNRLIADRGTRLALLTLVNLRETFEEGPRFRLQSETVQAPQDSRDPQMIMIAG